MIRTYFCVLLFLLACVPDNNKMSQDEIKYEVDDSILEKDTIVRPDVSAKGYFQKTYEIQQDSLIPSSVDIEVLSSSRVTIGQKASYNILYKKSKEVKDTIYFDTVYFATLDRRNIHTNPKEVANQLKRLKPSPYFDIAMIPNTPFIIKQNDFSFGMGVSQFSRCALPSYINKRERRSEWCVIFPYEVKNSRKCLILYELDSVFNKSIYQEDLIHDDQFKLDSLYHFP